MDATFCRRCGLPYGDTPRANAELPTCPICYLTVDHRRSDRQPRNLPGLRVDLRRHMAEHDRHPVGDDEWLKTLREGDKLRWGRWTAPFETVRRYLVTGQVNAGRNRQLAHDMIVTAMTQINQFGSNAEYLRRPARVASRTDRSQRADGALRAGSPLTSTAGIEPLAIAVSHWDRSRSGGRGTRWATMRQDLVERARHGDREAFGRLAAGEVDRLHAIARLVLRDPELAEDAVQEALVRCWRQLLKLRDIERFDGWLYRILMHAIADEFGRRRRFEATVQAVHVEPSTSDGARDRADRDELEQGFRHLRSTIGRSSSCITTSACPCPRPRPRSASPAGPRSPDTTMRCRRCGLRSRPKGAGAPKRRCLA